ncbi:hypothetical protein WOLCODRAFT_140172 [Wolfiporia cocos MD-104 SS10]|uniref:BZIP domain-containing protein n=1 Tax=Wolfiporia cocos (strain MD-104) TaxID=742152 RepID=A0A2H3J178_WOLCO|nr:hypothetical protein WOLCODRAFT_140172 [Wolfiporia cocos MD-104 SS10]
MAPSHLQGLNIVHPSPPATPYLSDADLLSLPPFPDLNAQLDLWTNLNFQSDEPLGLPISDSNKSGSKRRYGDDGADRYNDQDDDLQSNGGIAETNAHENVVTGTVLPPTGVAHSGHPNPTQPVPAPGGDVNMQMPSLDIHSLLAGIGIDPFLVTPMQQAPHQPTNANSIAQLLSLHAASFLPPHLANPPIVPQAQSPPAPPTPQSQAPSPAQQPSPPAPKRARTGRSSFSSVDQHGSPADSPEAEEKESATPFTAAEDKRRRNTAASARFRLKKKEREAALERKAKELEVRVGELEKECEALRRENGWLKGLVVGVTGVGTVQQQVGAAPPSSAGTKRGREDGEPSRREEQ